MSCVHLAVLTGRASVVKLWTLELSCLDFSPSTTTVTLSKSLYQRVVSTAHLLSGSAISGTALLLGARIKCVNIFPALRMESGAE